MNAKIEVSVPTDLDRIKLRVRCPESLDRESIQSIQDILRKAIRKVDNIVRKSGGLASWTYQTYEASVFWFLIFYRPLQFQYEHGLLRNGILIREMLSEAGAAALRMSNQGVILDAKKNWLILVWGEARESGVLCGIEQIPLWRRVLMQQLRCGEAGVARLKKEVHDRLARHIAASTAFLVPHWVLHRTGYFREKLFWLPDEERANLMVFDLAGIDAVLNDVVDVAATRERRAELATPFDAKTVDETTDRAGLSDEEKLCQSYHTVARQKEVELIEGLRPYPTKRCGTYTHLYTTSRTDYQDARRDYRNIQRQALAKQPQEKKRVHEAVEMSKLRRAFDMDNHITPRAGREVSRVVQQLAKNLGYMRNGRWLAFVSKQESLRMLELCCKRCLWSFTQSQSPELKELMGSALEAGDVRETKYTGWSENRAKRVESIAINLESLVNAWELPLEYAVWVTAKNLDGKYESVVAWAHETLEQVKNLQESMTRTRRKKGKKGKKGKKTEKRQRKGDRSRGVETEKACEGNGADECGC